MSSNHVKIGSREVCIGTERGPELPSHDSRCLIENPMPKEKIILKFEIENSFNSINRQYMLDKNFAIHPEVYKYSQSVYSQSSFFCTVIQ